MSLTEIGLEISLNIRLSFCIISIFLDFLLGIIILLK
jgi:hypothetical protein